MREILDVIRISSGAKAKKIGTQNILFCVKLHIGCEGY